MANAIRNTLALQLDGNMKNANGSHAVAGKGPINRSTGCNQYIRDKRPDCPQVVIALVVTPDGLPLAYEVLPGNTADCTTLRMFLARIERQYGRARRVWVMDRGIPTDAGTGGNAQQRPTGAVSGGNAERASLAA